MIKGNMFGFYDEFRQTIEFMRSTWKVTHLTSVLISAFNSTLAPGYGTIYLHLATGDSLASAKLPAPATGRMLVIDASACVGNGRIALNVVSAAGYSLIGLATGSSLSILRVSIGAAVHLYGQSDTTWAVVSVTGTVSNVTEYPI